MKNGMQQYKSELSVQLSAILQWWMVHAPDKHQGGFVGKIDNSNHVQANAPKGSVLNSRILYTFSAAYNLFKTPAYLEVATRAFEYIADHFVDEQYGGVYWTVDQTGEPLDTKKQVYAIAFVIYGLAEHYAATKNERAKELAFSLYNQIEKHAHDTVKGGYIEALSRDWQPIEDIRLSAKDYNESKSMNTHLHVLEAYTNMYKVWPFEQVKKNISKLIQLFLNHIIDPLTNHLTLFFDDDWNPRSGIISFGHDIEAAWLLLEAAEVINDEALINMVRYRSQKITEAAARGLDSDGGLWYEKDFGLNHLVKEKHWWPQAEAMVGFFNNWQITGQDKYLQYSLNSWAFIKQFILDHEYGEWFWGVDENGTVMPHEDKAGLWKCPYHNGRACMELIKRIRGDDQAISD